MPYIAQVPNDLVTLQADVLVVNTNSNHLLNEMFSDIHETTGDISATNEGGNGAVAENGETITVPTAAGDYSGEYVGPVVFSTQNVTVGVPTLAAINVKVNDIEGHVFRNEDGSTYVISDQPMDEDRLGVTASITIAGISFSVDVPLSEVASGLTGSIRDYANGLSPLNPLRLTLLTAAGVVEGVANVSQVVLDTAVINVAEGTGELGVVCFGRGTMIVTVNGPVAVEDLRAGDQVVTADDGLQPIRWIGRRTINTRELHAYPNLYPIRIRADALAPGVPTEDLVVSPQHRILIRSTVAQRMFGSAEVLVAAKQLLELDGVELADDLDEIEYFHILFDRHEIVLANGTETESLFTGAQALRSVGESALSEIFAILPELGSEEHIPTSVRNIAVGKQARKMVSRHILNGKSLTTPHGASHSEMTMH